jgi:hypothetical protein
MSPEQILSDLAIPSCLRGHPTLETGLALLGLVERAVGGEKPTAYALATPDILAAVGLPDAPHLQEVFYGSFNAPLRAWGERYRRAMKSAGVKFGKALPNLSRKARVFIVESCLLDKEANRPVAAVIRSVVHCDSRTQAFTDFAVLHADHYVRLLLLSAKCSPCTEQQREELMSGFTEVLVRHVKKQQLFRVEVTPE